MPAELSADAAAAALDGLTSKAQSCQGPANQISIVNIALAVSGFGPIPVVIARLTDIVTSTGSVINPSTSYTAKSDQYTVLKSVTTFVEVNQALLNILIGKAGLVPNLLPYVGPPLAQTLRQLESLYDTVLYELIDCCPDLTTQLTNQKDSLDMTLAKSIEIWSGVNVSF